jgi:3-hydroxybutyrate dehydrogenase
VSRQAIVTGAASGIGRAVAQALVDAGADVLAVDLESDANGPGRPFAADLTTRAGNRAAVDAAVAAFGGLDTIVTDAGWTAR